MRLAAWRLASGCGCSDARFVRNSDIKVLVPSLVGSHRCRMGLNGNRFKISDGRRPCPECKGYPALKVVDNRHVPHCDTCGGRGSVPATMPDNTDTKSGLR